MQRALHAQQLVKGKTTQTGSFFNQSGIKLEHSAWKEFKNKDQSRSSDGNIRKTIALFIIYEICIYTRSTNYSYFLYFEFFLVNYTTSKTVLVFMYTVLTDQFKLIYYISEYMRLQFTIKSSSVFFRQGHKNCISLFIYDIL